MNGNRIIKLGINALLRSKFIRTRKGMGTALAVLAALATGHYAINDSQAKRGNGSGKTQHVAGKFDYFTLVLSWSPTYCANNRHDKAQCGPRRHYAFVVHGLWPQYNRGWPQDCRVPKGQYYVQDATINKMLDIMPSRRLVIHEWRKHGTCAGVPQAKYFAATRALYKKIKIPPRYQRPNTVITTSPQRLKQEFVQANKNWLKPGMISVQCGNRKDRGKLREIRFCFDKTGRPIMCGYNEKRECRAKLLTLPPVR